LKPKQWFQNQLTRLAQAGQVEVGTRRTKLYERLRHINRCMRFIERNGIEGDILQFGVAGGGTLARSAERAKFLRQVIDSQMRVFGFDSFEGLPESKGGDRDFLHGQQGFEQGKFKSEKRGALAALSKLGLEPNDARLIEGWYEDSLTPELRDELGLQRACLIDIDCDLYESTAVALSWCAPLIQQGTVISFDDWFCYRGSPRHGENRAFREFLAAHPELSAETFATYGWNGKAFILSTVGGIDEIGED